jgi:hypothetical protein
LTENKTDQHSPVKKNIIKSIKTTLAALLLTAALLPSVSCKKENATSSTTTQEKILGRWNWISEVTNDYHGGMSHIHLQYGGRGLYGVQE